MNLRNLAIWGVIVVGPDHALQRDEPGRAAPAATSEITYSQLLDQGRLRRGEGRRRSAARPWSRSRDTAGPPFTATTPQSQDDLLKRLEASGVGHRRQVRPALAAGCSCSDSLLPILLLIGVWIFFMRQMQGGARGAMGFGKSKARLLTENKNRVTFDDVAGVDEAKEELQRDRRLPEGPRQVPAPGRQDPQGRPAGRPSRHR